MSGAGTTSPGALAWALAPGTLLAGVAGGIAFPILPIAATHAGLSLPLIGLILAANRAMRVIANPMVGLCADRIGGRRTLLIGLVVQVAVLLLYGLGIATGHVGSYFLAGRLLHGPGSSCVFIAAQALALHAGGPLHGGRTAGIVRATMVLGVPVGLSLGGLLSDAIGDASTFAVAAGAVALAALVAFMRVPDLRAPIRERPGWATTLQGFADRRLLAVGTINFVLNFSAGGMILTTLALLVHERRLSAFGRNEQFTAGLLMGLMIALEAATTPLMGRLGDRGRAHARIAAIGMALLSAGAVGIALSARVSGIACGLALMGVGIAGLGPSLLVITGSLIPPERRGTAVGLLQLCGDLGGTLGPVVGTALLASSTTTPYLGTAALALACMPLALWLAWLEVRAQQASPASPNAEPNASMREP